MTDDLGEHCTWRRAGDIKSGYHVLVGETWVRVDAVQERRTRVLLVVGDATVSFREDDRLWSRSPAEQVYAVSAALPMRGRVGAPLRPMGNPFNGSAPTPIAGLESPHAGWAGK